MHQMRHAQCLHKQHCAAQLVAVATSTASDLLLPLQLLVSNTGLRMISLPAGTLLFMRWG
jgi:hypothetical protein